MKASQRRSGREERTRKTQMDLGVKLPFGMQRNPFKVETKVASAGVDLMKKGIFAFFKVRF